jgi:ABC-type sugar transport system permease subunit
MKKKSGNDNIGYLFLLPNFLIYGLFILVPLLYSVFYSFTNFNLFEWEFVGLRNYKFMFNDDHFIKALMNTAKYTVGSIFISMILGLFLAISLNSDIWGKKIFRPLFFIPNTVSVIAASMAWLYIYNNNVGILNIFLSSIGLPKRNWLLDIDLALNSIIVVGIWASMGYNMIVYLAGLQTIPGYLYEAARIDGASGIRQFFSITLPMLAPTTFFLFVMGTIRSFQVFGQVYAMTNGGPMNSTTTIVHHL